MSEKNIKRLNASEQQGLIALYAALNALKDSEDLDTRLELIPNGKGMRNGAQGMIRKLAEKIMDTMPTEQLISFSRNLRTLRYYVEVSRPSGRQYKNDGRWLSYDALDTLCAAAQEGRCLVCQKNKQEQKQCPLAKAFDELPCAKALENAGGCKYFTSLI